MSGLSYSEDLRTPEHIPSPSEVDELDRLVQDVAAAMPFPVETEADMGGTFVLQIELGRRDGENGEPDRAGIDPEPGSTWWMETGGGVEQSFSDLKRDASPAVVAAWISSEAHRFGSPAAVSADGATSADKLTAIKLRQTSARDQARSAPPAPALDRGQVSL